MIQVFTVISQVALASILGVYHSYGFDTQFIPHYLITYCRSFMIALPVQLFIVGAMARYLFRVLFSSTNGVEEEKIEKEFFYRFMCNFFAKIVYQELHVFCDSLLYSRIEGFTNI